MHEAQLQPENAFITLTYNDTNLPFGGTLVKKDFQDFIKRLRKRCGRLRYFHCGEYGESCKLCDKSRRKCRCARFIRGLGRPHYHALLFGLSFPDLVVHARPANGHVVYTSAILSDVWARGFCTVGAVTFESAAYTARYIMEKVNGDLAAPHYEKIMPETGEVVHRIPEYITMSLKPAVSKDWYGAFSSDVYPDDFVVARGQKMKPPKYYDKLHELVDPAAHAEIKKERRRYAGTQKTNATPERLAVREKVTRARISQSQRTLE